MSQQGFAVVSYRPGAHGEGWMIPDAVSVGHIMDRDKAQECADGRNGNGLRSAVIPWGPDLHDWVEGGPQPDTAPINNHRVRRSLDLPVRYFECDDTGCRWYIVAVNQDHAAELLRRNCDAFGPEQVPFGLATLTWRELTAEDAAHKRCHRDDGVAPVALSVCDLGECFSTEW